MEVFHDTATECHLSYGISQCYLLPMTVALMGRQTPSFSSFVSRSELWDWVIAVWLW